MESQDLVALGEAGRVLGDDLVLLDQGRGHGRDLSQPDARLLELDLGRDQRLPDHAQGAAHAHRSGQAGFKVQVAGPLFVGGRNERCDIHSVSLVQHERGRQVAA